MKERFALSATTLKLLAIVAMTIDHAALAFIPPETTLYFFLRCIGRLTAPIMSFCIAEGFYFTHSRKKYLLRMLLFAVISQPAFFAMIYGRMPHHPAECIMHWNVLFTLSIAIVVLMLYTRPMRREVKCILMFCCAAAADLCDWSYLIPAWVLVFYALREQPKRKATAFVIVSVILVFLRFLPSAESLSAFAYQFGVLMALIPLRFYNGKRGGAQSGRLRFLSCFAFYVYYPLHMMVIALLRLFLNIVSF